MRTAGIWAMIALTTYTNWFTGCFCCCFARKRYSVQPVQSTTSEETFQTLLVSKALEKLGYEATS